jgi:hypothetical protein
MDLMRFKAQDDKHDRAGTYVVLVTKYGPKWIHLMYLDSSGLKIEKVPSKDHRWMTPMENYPLKRAVNHFKRAAKKFGATNAALTALKGAT